MTSFFSGSFSSPLARGCHILLSSNAANIRQKQSPDPLQIWFRSLFAFIEIMRRIDPLFYRIDLALQFGLNIVNIAQPDHETRRARRKMIQRNGNASDKLANRNFNLGCNEKDAIVA